MPCGRFKRVRQAQVVSPECNAFKRKLKLTILMTLVSEKQHDHPEGIAAASEGIVRGRKTTNDPIHALTAGNAEADLFLAQLRQRVAESTAIPRKEK